MSTPIVLKIYQKEGLHRIALKCNKAILFRNRIMASEYSCTSCKRYSSSNIKICIISTCGGQWHPLSGISLKWFNNQITPSVDD